MLISAKPTADPSGPAGMVLGVAIVAVMSSACSFDRSGLAGDRDGGKSPADARLGDANPSIDGPGAQDSLLPGDVRLVYGEVSSSQLRSQRWIRSSAAWTIDAPPPPASGNPVWTVNAVTQDDDVLTELVAAQLNTAGGNSVVVYSFDVDEWVLDFEAPFALGSDTKRSFDLAVEASGDALVVYAGGGTTPRYRTRTGGSWSAEQALPLNDGDGPQPDTNVGTVRWVELEQRIGTDQIGLAFSDSTRALVSIEWDGEHWVDVSARTLETDLKLNTLSFDVANRAFDLAWETVNGDMLVAWSRSGNSAFYYDRWSRGAWLPSAIRETGVVSGQPHFVELAAKPSSDQIAAGFYDMGDGTERLGAAMWTGNSWDDKGELDSQTRNVDDTAVGDMPGIVTWVGDVAIMVYSDNQTGTLDWALWREGDGWNVELDVAFAGKGVTESVRAAVSADVGRAIVVLLDDNLRLYATSFDGASWQLSNGGAPLTTVAASTNTVPFSLVARP